MGDFRFFAPEQPNISGVIAGASGLLQGGQAKGAGLAAEGQAKGQGMAALGAQIGQGLKEKAAQDKADKQAEAVTAYLDSSEDENNFYDRPWMDIEETNDPNVRAMYEDSLQAQGDPDVIRARLHGNLVNYFISERGKDQQGATDFANNMLRIETDRVLKPEARARLSKARNLLVGQGVNPQALHALSSSRGVRGYPTEKSLVEDRTKRANESYGYQTEAEKMRLKLREEEAIAQQKSARAQRESAEIDRALAAVVSEPIMVPTGVGGGAVPTGMQRVRGMKMVSPESYAPGKLEELEGRENVPGSSRPSMMKQEPVFFVGARALKEVRELLRAKDIPETGLDEELLQRKWFADESDPAYRAYMDEQIDVIEKRFSPSEAPVGRDGGFSQGDRQLFSLMQREIDAQKGKPLTGVPVMAFKSLDSGVLNEIMSIAGYTGSKDQVESVRLGTDSNGDVVLVSGVGETLTQLDPQDAARLKKMLGSPALADEVAFKQASGAAGAWTNTQIQKFMAYQREQAGGAGFRSIKQAARGTQGTVPDGSQFSPGEAALFNAGDPTQTVVSGARIGGTPPSKPKTQAQMDTDSRNSTGVMSDEEKRLEPLVESALMLLEQQALTDKVLGNKGGMKSKKALADKLRALAKAGKLEEVKTLLLKLKR